MKKHIFIIALVTILTTPATFAYISGKALVTEAPILCPTSIICHKKTVSNSCRLENVGDLQYWKSLPKYPLFQPGTYDFARASANYHSKSPQAPTCVYEGHHFNGQIKLDAKPESNLEVNYYYENKDSNWFVNNGVGNCTPHSPTASADCALKVKSAVLIHNIDITEGVFSSINGTPISDITPASSYTSLMFDDAIVGCGSVKICEINLVSPKGAKYGSITVDMDNKMKVIGIKAYHPSEVEINIIWKFNTIEIKYHA